MTLRALPKPEGFDLRAARAEKHDDGRQWLPADALFDASEQMTTDAPPEVAFLVAWYTRREDGKLSIKYRCAFENDRQAIALAADLLRDLQSPA